MWKKKRGKEWERERREEEGSKRKEREEVNEINEDELGDEEDATTAMPVWESSHKSWTIVWKCLQFLLLRL